MSQAPERTVPMEIVIKAGDDIISTKAFNLYEGTELIYVQGVDLAVTKALGQISKIAYDLIGEAGDDVPEKMAIEALLGRAVQSAQ